MKFKKGDIAVCKNINENFKDVLTIGKEYPVLNVAVFKKTGERILIKDNQQELTYFKINKFIKGMK